MAGTLFLAAAVGLGRASDPVVSGVAPALIGAAGAGLIGSAVFTTDPVSGYPPGTPDAPAHPTRAGIAHNLAAVPVFAGLPAAALAGSGQAWRAGQHRFGLYSAAYRRDHVGRRVHGWCRLRPVQQSGWLGRAAPARQHISGFAMVMASSAPALRNVTAASTDTRVPVPSRPLGPTRPTASSQSSERLFLVGPASTTAASRQANAGSGRIPR